MSQRTSVSLNQCRNNAVVAPALEGPAVPPDSTDDRLVMSASVELRRSNCERPTSAISFDRPKRLRTGRQRWDRWLENDLARHDHAAAREADSRACARASRDRSLHA